MNFNFSKKLSFIAKVCAIFLLFNLLFLNSTPAFADDIKNRFRTCDPRGGEGKPEDNVTAESLDFNPSSGGKDVQFDLDNPVCFSIIVAGYAAVKTSIAGMNYACGSGDAVPRVIPSPLLDAVDVAKAGAKAIGGTPACKAAWLNAAFQLQLFIEEIAIIYGIAKDVYKNAHVCGYDWKRWDAQTMLKDLIGGGQNEMQSWMKDSANQNTINTNGLSVRQYREWYYNGKEYSDTGDYCEDVTADQLTPATYITGDRIPVVLGGTNKKYPPQKYYLRGTDTPNFNCEKYNPKNAPSGRYDEYQSAYQCCKNKSQNSICIEYRRIGTSSPTYAFCEAGSRCNIEGVSFSAGFEYSNRLICASTWSLCPYNFNLDGGTTECDYFQDGVNGKLISPDDVKNGTCAGKSEVRDDDCRYNIKAGRCRNYCQILNHCVVVNSVYNYESSIDSPYFSRACLDFVGDSKNGEPGGSGMSYDTGLFGGPQRHFTAPIAQCVKETMENVFYNRAGHSKCLNVSEVPDKNGQCFSGTYIYKKGNTVNKQSFFSMLQSKTNFIVKLILTMLIVMNGIKILLAGQPIKKNELIMLVVKISIVTYFATGAAWQSTFFEGVYRGSDAISKLVMKIKTDADESKRDGCQFGNIAIQTNSNANGPNPIYQFGTSYPPGTEYLAIWDALDCKIARYLGYGPTANGSAANIFILIAASFFTWPVGVYFTVLLLIFGMFMIIAALRALHIFLVSAMSIILMVYISIITIPACLFKKTEGIFKSWLTNLIAFSLQPIILFAYIGMFVSIFDSVVMGSATFRGSAPNKVVVCDEQCRDNVGNTITTKADGTPLIDVEKDCDEGNNQKIVRPQNDSVACIININNVSKFPGFEIIGVSIPIIADLFKSGGRDKILTLIKAALLIYVLAQFIDEIPGISSSLIGKGLPGSSLPLNINKMAAGAKGAISAIQKRTARASKKAAGSAMDKIKNVANRAGDKGTSVAKDDGSKKGGGDGKDESVRDE